MTYQRRAGRLARGELAAQTVRQLEIDLQRQLVGKDGLATIYGWEHVHFRPALTKHGWRTPGSGTMAAGWPDLVLLRARDRRLIFAELKSDAGKVTQDQQRVLETLRVLTADHVDGSGHRVLDPIGVAGPRVEVYVWRPRDFDQIIEVLR